MASEAVQDAATAPKRPRVVVSYGPHWPSWDANAGRRLFVEGKAVPQGSMLAINSKSTGKAIAIHENARDLRAWRKAIEAAWREAHAPVFGRVIVELRFVLAPVVSGRQPDYDVDKLTRAALDALSGVAFTDDKAVEFVAAAKVLGEPFEPTGVHVYVAPVTVLTKGE